MTRGNKKSDKWAVVINAKKDEDITILSSYEKRLVNHYKQFTATILHDKDMEGGKPKTPHIHAFITTEQKTKNAILTELTELLGVDVNQVSVDVTNSDILYVQYLIHKNDQDKHQYDKGDILTNNKIELDKRLNEGYISPQDKERKMIQDMVNMDYTEIILNYGLEIGRRYLSLIKQLKEEHRQNDAYSLLLHDFEQLQRNFKQLYEIAHKLILDCSNGLLDNYKFIIAYNAKLQQIEDIYAETFVK